VACSRRTGRSPFAALAVTIAAASAAFVLAVVGDAQSATGAVATARLNGNFANGLHGWAAYRSRLFLIRGGHSGKAVRVVPRSRRRSFSVYRRVRPATGVRAGTAYVARAWVRGAARGRHSACLRVRQVVAARVVERRRACVTTTRRWRSFPAIRLVAPCSGGSVGLAVVGRRSRFDVDAVSLRAVGGPAAAGGAATCATQSQRKEKPAPGKPPAPPPDASFLNPFPAGSLWNTPLSTSPRLDAASADKIAYWLTQIRYPNMALRSYATAIAVASTGSPTYAVSCTMYACPTMGQFGPVPIPAGTRPDPSSDGHLAVWDPTAHREWDFWVSNCPLDCSRAGGGAAFSTDSLSPAVPGSSAANAAGWPLLAGIVHPEEIQAGHIDHPLVFSSPNVGSGSVCPAIRSDGGNAEPRALREGTLLQLDPALDVGSLAVPAWQKTIARALQQYGMYLVDGGGTLSIRAENPINRGDLWGALGLTGNSATFGSSFPWSRMRVLAPPAPWC
jgi:hypothetical protein